MTTITPEQLCRVFRDRASVVFKLIEESHRVGLGVGEETITDVNLFEINQRLPAGHVVTKKFTKREEGAESGADWLWTIGRPGRWLSLLIQAKLLRPGRPTLHNLHHGKGSQRRNLVKYARQHGCMPLYVIYTAAAGTRPVCPIHHREPDQLGCAIVRVRHVANMYRRRKGKTNAAILLAGSRPWACLFCCSNAQGDNELADAAAHGLVQVPMPGFWKPREGEPEPEWEELLGPRWRLGEDDGEEDEPDDFLRDPESLVRSEVPEIVSLVLRDQPVPRATVAGVTVVSSVSLDNLMRHRD